MSSRDSFRRRVRENDLGIRTTILRVWKKRWCDDAGDDDCHICTLKPSKRNGYCQGSYDGNNKFVLVHVVAAWEESGGVDITGNLTASHLCGNPACFNPRHMTTETREANQGRKGCVGTVRDVQGKNFRVCQHNPPCLKLTKLEDFPQV